MQTAKQIIHYTSCLFVSKKQQLSVPLYLPLPVCRLLRTAKLAGIPFPLGERFCVRHATLLPVQIRPIPTENRREGGTPRRGFATAVAAFSAAVPFVAALAPNFYLPSPNAKPAIA